MNRPTEFNQDINGSDGVKFDAGKVRLDLVPGEFTFAVAAVLTYGERKYAAWNWARGMSKGRLLAAMQRHLLAYTMGEECDPESGLPHTWHAATCMAMLIGTEMRGTSTEDRACHLSAYAHAQQIYAGMKDPRLNSLGDPDPEIEQSPPPLLSTPPVAWTRRSRPLLQES